MQRQTALDEPPKAIELAVDRPFSFFIVHDTSGLVLFAGRVADPSRA